MFRCESYKMAQKSRFLSRSNRPAGVIESAKRSTNCFQASLCKSSVVSIISSTAISRTICEQTHSFNAFSVRVPYTCPEPVLATHHFQKEQGP